MKTILLVITFVLSLGWVNAQEWPPLVFADDNAPWRGFGSVPEFAMDEDGNLYISIRDLDETYHTIVRKYEDGKWNTVGTEDFSDPFEESLFAVAPDGTPYVTHGVEGALVSRFNGITWEAVGTTEYNVTPSAIAVDDDGTPYIAGGDADHDRKVTVLKLVDDTWQIVGNAGFTDTPMGQISLSIAPDGTPYLTGNVPRTIFKSIVMKLDGDTWETVGESAILEGIGYPRLSFADDSTPYMAYTDSLDGYKATVIRFDGSEWQTVGEQGFSAARTVPDIVIDGNGTPYVAYSDSSLGRKIIVKKFTNGSWVTVGNAGFSGFDAVLPSILISPAGTPYVAYADQVTGVDSYLYRVKVARLDGDTWQAVGSGELAGTGSAIYNLVATPDGILYGTYYYDFRISIDLQIWNKIKVAKWEDDTWTDVGDIDYFKGIENIRLAIAPDGTPYMAYTDSASDFKLKVIKLEGDSWETVGNPFEANSYSDFDIDSTGIPYLTLQTNVWSFNGSDWAPVNAEGFSESPTSALLAIDKDGTHYVAYVDADNNYQLKIKKLVNSVWEDISGTVTDEGATYPVFFSTDDSNNLYVAYTMNNNTVTRFMKLEDNNWVNLYEDITDYTLTSIAMDPEGIFFVAIKNSSEEASVITFNGSSRKTIVDQDILEEHLPHLNVDRMGNLYMVFDRDNVWVYKYEQQCTNPTNGGTIAGSQSGCDAFDPKMITSSDAPSGHQGTLEYKWQSSTTGSNEGFTDISNNAATYDPGIINQTTWFRRLVKVACMPDWTGAAVSDVVTITVVKLPELNCPDDDAVFNDPGSLYARKSYSAVPEGTPDSLAIYMVDGKAITFPYDFPIGTTTVEVKANSKCAVDVACSFTVTVTPVTGLEDWDVSDATIGIYPNPFTTELAIEIANPSLKEVSVEIFSISGQKIRTLAKGLKGANISLSWNGSDEQGKQVPFGVYLLKVNDQAKRVVFGK